MNNNFDKLKTEITLATYLGTSDKLIRCPNPSHEDRNPSCSVDHHTNRYHCFSCGEHGDIFDLVKLQHGYDTKRAAEWLGERFGVKVEWTAQHKAERDREKRIQDARMRAVKFWHQDLMEKETPFKILNGRGFGEELIKKMKLGYAKGDLVARLQAHYPIGDLELQEADFIAAGIFKTNKDGSKVYDAFQNRIIYPLIYAGQVANITGRSIIEGDPKKYQHLDGVKVDYLYNEAALTNPDQMVWLMEGQPDTLAAISLDLPAVGVLGTGGLTKPDKLKHLKTVFVCADNDDAGKRAAASWATLLLKENPEMELKFVELPEGINDFNDWVMDIRSKKLDPNAEYHRLVDGSKNFIEWKISQITTIEDVPQVWPILEALSPISRDSVFRRLRDQLGKSVQLTTLRESFKKWQGELQITMARSAKITDVSFLPPDFKSAAVEFYENNKGEPVAHYGFWAGLKRASDDGTELTTQEPVLIQAIHREDGTIAAEMVTLADLDFDILARRVPEASLVQGRWSDTGMKSFLQNPSERVTTWELIENIKTMIRQYIWYRDDATYTLMAIYALGTYIAKRFDAFPYLLFNGMKGTGKTNSLMLMEELCFNSMMASSCTIATTFRLIENSFCTWIRDEAEVFNTGNQMTPEQLEENTILNSGYKKGATVRRTAMGKNGEATLQSFDVYSPKIFGGIRVVNNVLADRSILVRTNKKPRESQIELRKMTQERRKWTKQAKDIRDQIYPWALSVFPDALAIYEGFLPVKGIDDREWELWLPLFTIARMADYEQNPDVGFYNPKTDTYSGAYLVEMIDLAKRVILEKKTQAKQESFEIKVLDTLSSFLRDGDLIPNGNHPTFYASSVVLKKLNEQLKEESAIKHDISAAKFHAMMLQTGVIECRVEQIKRMWHQCKMTFHIQLTLEAIESAMGS